MVWLSSAICNGFHMCLGFDCRFPLLLNTFEMKATEHYDKFDNSSSACTNFKPQILCISVFAKTDISGKCPHQNIVCKHRSISRRTIQHGKNNTFYIFQPYLCRNKFDARRTSGLRRHVMQCCALQCSAMYNIYCTHACANVRAYIRMYNCM